MVRKFRKSDSFGNAVVATNLKSARIAAGFRSAASAALAHGWSENTLRGHESGTRNINTVDAKKYAEAFKTDVMLFAPPNSKARDNHDRRLADLETAKKEAAAKETAQKSLIANRLRFARTVRGFDTLSAACGYTGLGRATAGGHENGFNSLSERMAEAYCVAYGVNIGWLLHGNLPSGMGSEIDARIENLDWLDKSADLAHECRPLLSSALPDNREHILLQFDRALAKPRASYISGDRMFEFDRDNGDGLSPLEDLSESEDGRSWTLPPGLMSKLIGAHPSEVVVVPVDRTRLRWRLGDRLFVDRSKRDISVGGFFLYYRPDYGLRIEESHRGQVSFDVPESADLVGMIVASFSAHGVERRAVKLTKDWPD